MGVLKNEVGRPTNKTILIRRTLKIVAAVIVLVIVFFGGYYINSIQKNNDKKTNSNVSNNSKEDSNTNANNDVDNNETDAKLTDAKVQEIFNRYNLFTNWLDVFDNENVSSSFYKNNTSMFDHSYSYFYDKGKVTNNTISDNMKFVISIANLYGVEKEYTGSDLNYKSFDFAENEEILFENINEECKKLFGNGININSIMDSNNNIIVGVYGFSFKYNDSKKVIIAHNHGIGDASSIDYYTKITNINNNTNKLEITSKVVFVICEAGEDYCYVSKTNQDINNIKDTITKRSGAMNVKVDDYLDKLNSYKWTFIKDSNGNYVFESVEKINN